VSHHPPVKGISSRNFQLVAGFLALGNRWGYFCFIRSSRSQVNSGPRLALHLTFTMGIRPCFSLLTSLLLSTMWARKAGHFFCRYFCALVQDTIRRLSPDLSPYTILVSPLGRLSRTASSNHMTSAWWGSTQSMPTILSKLPMVIGSKLTEKTWSYPRKSHISVVCSFSSKNVWFRFIKCGLTLGQFISVTIFTPQYVAFWFRRRVIVSLLNCVWIAQYTQILYLKYLCLYCLLFKVQCMYFVSNVLLSTSLT
jgi:hypothetical protein